MKFKGENKEFERCSDCMTQICYDDTIFPIQQDGKTYVYCTRCGKKNMELAAENKNRKR